MSRKTNKNWKRKLDKIQSAKMKKPWQRKKKYHTRPSRGRRR